MWWSDRHEQACLSATNFVCQRNHRQRKPGTYGLLIKEEAIEHVRKIAERERAPMYVVGETTGDHRFAFQQADGVRPFDLAVEQMFGSSPKTYMVDKTVERHYEMPKYELPNYMNT